MQWINWLWAMLLFYNIFVFALMGADKRKAVKGRRRVRERTLLWCAALGGGLGGVLGMCLFRHKTQHLKFQILMPVFFIAQLGLLFLLYVLALA